MIIFILVLYISYQRVLTDVTNSVTGKVQSISTCNLTSSWQIPRECEQHASTDALKIITALQHAEVAVTPSHGRRQKDLLLKIATNSKDTTIVVRCFVVVEYVNFKQELYLLPIETGENCSGGTFKYVAGSVKVDNFLSQ